MSSNHISQRIENVLNSVTQILRFFNNPAFEHRGDDPLACDFALGNPHEMPLPEYVGALQRAIQPRDKDWFAYKMSEPAPVAALAEGLYKWRGVRYEPQDIFLTTGAFAGLVVILGTILDPGDEVIFNSPPWFFYEPMIIANNCVPIRVRVNPDTHDLDIDGIAAAITPRTRAIIVNSPNNPTGKIYPTETLRRLADLLESAQRRNGRPLYLLSDESYSRIIYDGRQYPSPTQYYPNSFLIYTYGKTLLTPGQRIGYIVLPPEMPEKERIRAALFISQLVSGYAFPNALLQHALPELNKLSIDVQHLQEKRDFMVGALQEMGYQLHSPEGTFYLLPRSPIEDDFAFNEILISHKIFCLPGTVVEKPGYFRISLTANDDMVQRSLPGFQAALDQARRM
jgi:aspartate aminotransferase